MLRVGKVSDINSQNRTARVFFPDVEIMSDWLKVVYHPPNVSSGYDVKVMAWMPAVGDVVLCIFNDDFNGDGYVLGALK